MIVWYRDETGGERPQFLLESSPTIENCSEMHRHYWIFLGAVFLFARPSVAAQNSELSERPPRVQVKAAIGPVEESIAQATILIPYKTLSDEANELIPIEFNLSGRQHEKIDVAEKIPNRTLRGIVHAVTKNIPHEGDIDYHFTIKRDAPFQFASQGGKLHVSAPISFSGQAGINGDLAKALSLNKKDINGAMTAWSDCTFSLNPDWTPQLSASTDFQWDHARFEVAHGIWVSIKGVTEGPLKSAMEKLPDQLIHAIGKNRIRDAVQASWKTHTIPIKITDQISAYLTLTPTKAGLSQLDYTPEGIAFRLLLGVKSSLSTENAVPFDGPALSLPPLTPLEAGDRLFKFKIPTSVSYKAIETAALDKLKKAPLKDNGLLGPVDITIHELELFPTEHDCLAIGMQMNVTVPDTPRLSTSGTFFLIAKPVLDPSTQSLKLAEIAFAHCLDNELWQSILPIFEGKIKKALESDFVIDLKPMIAMAKDAVNLGLKSPDVSKYAAITLQDDTLELQQLKISDSSLDFLIGFRGTLDVNLQNLDLSGR